MPYKNIDPTIWGPYLWKFMHYLTLAYPDNPTDADKDNLYNFFDSIKEVIPCEKCRYNFQVHLETTPLSEEILMDNVEVIKWLFNLHNKVNASLEKPILSYDDFIKDYTISKTPESKTLESKTLESKTLESNNINPDKTLEEIKRELKEEIKQELNRENNKENNTYTNNNIFDMIKNNKLVLVIIMFVILAVLIYINKKY
jgi:hypothetical protein